MSPLTNLIQPYPLAWPSAYSRTQSNRRHDAQFPTTFQQARWDVLGELMRFHAHDIVLSTNLRVNDKDEPIYDHEPEDPGVAIWFKIRQTRPTGIVLEQMAIACDRWSTVHLNLGALAATMQGLRGMYRFGTVHVLDAMIGGLTVSPDAHVSPEEEFHDFHGDPEPTTNGTIADWWHVFGFTHPAEASRDEVEKRYRDRVKQAHPDVGGDPEAMRIFNEAIEQARAHFAPTGERT
jgi:hypothetical protein